MTPATKVNVRNRTKAAAWYLREQAGRRGGERRFAPAGPWVDGRDGVASSEVTAYLVSARRVPWTASRSSPSIRT